LNGSVGASFVPGFGFELEAIGGPDQLSATLTALSGSSCPKQR
jgi:hypothetical protein